MKLTKISQEEKNIILELHAKKGYKSLNEQGTKPQVPAKSPTTAAPTIKSIQDTLNQPPANLVIQNSTNHNNIIFLSARDPRNPAKLLPNSTYKFQIGGKYKVFNFDVNLRNLKREKNGDLTGEAQPTNSVVQTAMMQFDKIKQNATPDGWLKIKIPVAKLNEGIAMLKKNPQSQATMDAGFGVNVTLNYLGK